MVRQHDPCGANANPLRLNRDMGDQDLGRTARQTLEIVMFGDPEPLVAKLICGPSCPNGTDDRLGGTTPAGTSTKSSRAGGRAARPASRHQFSPGGNHLRAPVIPSTGQKNPQLGASGLGAGFSIQIPSAKISTRSASASKEEETTGFGVPLGVRHHARVHKWSVRLGQSLLPHGQLVSIANLEGQVVQARLVGASGGVL